MISDSSNDLHKGTLEYVNLLQRHKDEITYRCRLKYIGLYVTKDGLSSKRRDSLFCDTNTNEINITIVIKSIAEKALWMKLYETPLTVCMVHDEKRLLNLSEFYIDSELA